MNDPTLARALNILIAMESGSPWTEGKTALYTAGLRNLPDVIGLTAVVQLSQTEEWRPSLAKILCKAVDLDQPAPSTGQAIQSVRLAISGSLRRINGHVVPIYGEPIPDISHPAISLTISELGGLASIRQMKESEFEKRFEKAYKECLDRWRKGVINEITQGKHVFAVEGEKPTGEIEEDRRQIVPGVSLVTTRRDGRNG